MRRVQSNRGGWRLLRSICRGSLSSLGLMLLTSTRGDAGQRFTLADEIGLTLFGDPNGGSPELRFSPDGNYFAVWTERGRLDVNRPEDSLRFYRSQDVEEFIKHTDQSRPPFPIWIVSRSTDQEGRIISNNWRWLSDSSGVAFLERTAGGYQRLLLADLGKQAIEPLTAAAENVNTFDVRDRRHYVYTVADKASGKKGADEAAAPAIVGTGRQLFELILPDDPVTLRIASRRHPLWAVVDGKRFEVKHEGAAIVFSEDLVLSPDGRTVVAKLPVQEAPVSWETLYPPPYPGYPYRLRAGRLDPLTGGGTPKEYVLISLESGAIRSLTEAPVSNDGGWFVLGSPQWSPDGKAILLPGTFIKPKDDAPSRPCVAMVDLSSNTRSCIEMLKGHTQNGVEDGYHMVEDARFVESDQQQVRVGFHTHEDFSVMGSTEYRRAADDSWQVAEQMKGGPPSGESEHDGLEVSVKQGLDKPPVLVAANKQASRVIWDPNPQLQDIELGQADVYSWKDRDGKDRKAGLYKPADYQRGKPYPLVIQTHGFTESEFRPSGVFPTAFAARALAAVGIVVLQTGAVGECGAATLEEGPCNAAGYEAVAKRLVAEGLADADKIGLIGFSRTCYYVMETLTASALHVKAASITDGVMETYLQFILYPDRMAKEANVMIGAPPFGEGLQQWLRRSPGFNLDKITAPLLVVGEGPLSLLYAMWEPYAGLRYLNKPVDLIMLNTDEHVLTNPAVRMASQGGTVDWFRFWLQGFEDPAAEKAEQYRRWEKLCDMQVEQNPNQPAFCVRSKTH